MQQTYRIFLASSYELKADREQFEIFIARQNNLLKDKNVYLQVVLWEDIGGEVYQTHKQDHYNKELKSCDIFVMLYWSKVGKFTNIEFDRALGQFRFTDHNPKIYVFEKIAPLPKTQNDVDKDSLVAFKKKYADEGQFPIQYKDAEELTGLFKTNLDKLFADKYLLEGSNKHKNPAECLYTDGNSVPIGFIGRDDELKAIREKLNKGGSLMLINAEGGIGKTSLAAKYWEESLSDYKYNAWLFCEVGIIPALKKLAPKLDVDLAGLNEEQQTEAMKQALMPIANDTLLVLDNANTADDIKEFIKVFRGFGWHVLLTSRCHAVLEKEQELHIEHLPPFLAKELFEKNYKEETTEFDTLLDRLLAAIGYHTLLTEIFSKNLAELRDIGETLAKFLNDLETKGLYLEERSFNIRTDYTLNVHKIADHTDAIIEILYDFTALEESERYYLVNLALLPAVNYDLKFLAQLFDPATIINLKKILDSLFQKGWLGYAESSYRISPVIQKLVLQRNKDSLRQDSERLLINLGEKLDGDGTYLTNLSYSEAAYFARLVPVITKNLEVNPFKLLGQLNDRSGVYNLAVGNLFEAKSAIEKYREIAIAVDDEKGLSISYTRLGDVLLELGDLTNAVDFYEKGRDLNEMLNNRYLRDASYKHSLSISYERLGDIHVRLKNLEKALEFYERENELIGQLCNEYPESLSFRAASAIFYEKLGSVYIRLYEIEKALNYFQKFNESIGKLYKEHPSYVYYKNALAVSFERLGSTHFSLGDLVMAFDCFQKFNELKKQLYHEHPNNTDFKNGFAISHDNLGDVYNRNSEIKMAKHHYQKAMVLWEELVVTTPQIAEFQRCLTMIGKKLSDLADII
ncbi:ATP-binding protein [Mucilaginibacter sp. BJC16-A38]|uniref:tetratricopeptide repeat protein n=1 Tax=Mucilaginibacter phenanthrenivorans TaxID=1234842 RepID=UPI0021581A10|nr:tetratricopeptide repeat protein [Mucilaginibacter phenanthrenivorans]MCR8558527.1 ATP-binding protein [Mucilaginibacter phenanthrenivorans]